MTYKCFKKLDENCCPLYSEKQTFRYFPCCVVMRREHEGQRYSTSYYTKMSTALVHMNCTEKVDMPEYFRVELSHFMSEMSRNIAEEIYKRG